MRDDDDEKIKNIEELARKALSSSPNTKKSFENNGNSVSVSTKTVKKKASKNYEEVDEDDDDHLHNQ